MTKIHEKDKILMFKLYNLWSIYMMGFRYLQFEGFPNMSEKRKLKKFQL